MSDLLSDMAKSLTRLPGPSPIEGWHWEAKVWRDPDALGAYVTFHATWRLVPTIETEEVSDDGGGATDGAADPA